jgi:hypothetical protein
MALVDDYIQFTEHEKGRPGRRAGIAVFLAAIDQVTDPATIKHLALEKLGQLQAAHKNPNTLASYVTSYRNGIRSYAATVDLTDSNSVETKDGRQHIALLHLDLDADFHKARNAASTAKRESKRRAATNFDPFAAIATAEAALKSPSIYEVAAAFEFLTGRRPVEVLRRQGFRVIGRYTLGFSGQVKKKASESGIEYEIYCLTDSAAIVDALARMNRESSLGKDLDGDSNKAIDSRRNSTLNTAVRRVFGAVLPVPGHHDTPGKKLTNGDLRAAYVQAAAVLFRSPTESMSRFAQTLLGHNSVAATVNYEDYCCLDSDGSPLAIGQWRERLLEAAAPAASKTKTSVTLDALTADRLRRQAGETMAERINHCVDAAEREPAKDAMIAELRRQIAILESQLQDSATQATEAADRFAAVPSEELRGSKVPGSAVAKIERAVAAIMAYNEGRPAAEQYALSEANIRYVSGSRHGTIKAWVLAHPEVAEYNAAAGFGLQHDRGKRPITEVIAW